MADSDADAASEVLSQKHRKERRDLQAEIQKLKHAIKADKRKKKEVTEQIAKLERELDDRQEKELEELQESADIGNVTERLNGLDTSDAMPTADSIPENDDTALHSVSTEKKVSKAQKRRNKKVTKERERQEEIKQQDIENLSGARHMELQQMKSALRRQDLQIFEINSDGNCLYNAVNHQLGKMGVTSSYETLRREVAQYMIDNKDDFLPFLTKDNGDAFTEEDFEKYCRDTARTTTWGGHLEVRALSQTLKQPIKIIQSEGPPISVGEDFEVKGEASIVLCYLRHVYSLGEHYNSVEEYRQEEEEEFT